MAERVAYPDVEGELLRAEEILEALELEEVNSECAGGVLVYSCPALVATCPGLVYFGPILVYFDDGLSFEDVDMGR